MEQKSIYIVLTRTTTIISRLIAGMTGDSRTHASIALDRDLSVMYSFGRKWRYYPFYGGFNQESLDEGIFGGCKVLPYTVIEIKVTQEQYDKVASLIQAYIQNAKRYRFNHMGLVFAWTGKKYQRSHRFYCSEFIHDLLHRCEIICDDSSVAIRPQELMRHGQVIEEGDWRLRSKKLNLNQ